VAAPYCELIENKIEMSDIHVFKRTQNFEMTAYYLRSEILQGIQ